MRSDGKSVMWAVRSVEGVIPSFRKCNSQKDSSPENHKFTLGYKWYNHVFYRNIATVL